MSLMLFMEVDLDLWHSFLRLGFPLWQMLVDFGSREESLKRSVGYSIIGLQKKRDGELREVVVVAVVVVVVGRKGERK